MTVDAQIKKGPVEVRKKIGFLPGKERGKKHKGSSGIRRSPAWKENKDKRH